MISISSGIIFNHICNTGRVNCGLKQEQIVDVVNAINELNLWLWIKDICPKKGFIFTENENAINIINKIDLSNHTGITIAFMMRLMQKIAEEILGTKESYCVICLESNCEKQISMDCGHRYHIECIRKWKSTSCPLCRSQTIPYKI